jgi:hypothetical protein
MTAVRAGAATRVLTLNAGLPLSGYVVDRREAEAPNEVLDVRALVIQSGSGTAVIVSYDLLYGSAGLTAQLRELVRAAHSIDGSSVLVNGTHTHCSPRDTTSRVDPELVSSLAERGLEAVTAALEAMAPVRVVSGAAPDIGIGRNRREPDGLVDDTAQLVVLQRLDGSVAATIVNLACHPVVLDDETTVYHPDFVGTLRSLVELAFGGTCLFLQGFAGDTNPVVLEHTTREAARVGARAAAPIVAALAGMLATDRDATVYNLSLGREVPVAQPSGTTHTGPIRGASALVDAAQRSLDQTDRPSATDEARRIEEWITALYRVQDPIFNSMDMLAEYRGEVQLEVQSIALGDGLLIVAFPGEPLGVSRVELAARFPGVRLLAVGYSNGSAGYLPYLAAYPASGYEIGCSIVAPGTAERLVDAVIDPRT